MGASFCGFRCRPRPNRSPENDRCGLKQSVMRLLRPRASLCAATQKFCPLENIVINTKVLTLEDWITSSPGFSDTNINNGGEMAVHKQSSRKIHPSSFDGGCKPELLPESVGEFSVSRGEAKNVQVESQNTSLCRSKSEKVKKKVSFRSPEVADVFVLDPSPEKCMATGKK